MGAEESERRIRQKTIEAQLAREFAERLEFEADAWLQMATAKRQKAIEYRMKAEALTVDACTILAGVKRAAKKQPATDG